MCGIVGVVSGGGQSVVRDLGNAAHFLQHRGPAYAGLFVFDPALRRATLHRGEGLADDIFKPLVQVPGDLGIAHTRYRTHGSGGVSCRRLGLRLSHSRQARRRDVGMGAGTARGATCGRPMVT